jgi:hypothetical protein
VAKREYACSKCETVIEIEMSVHEPSRPKLYRKCGLCGKRRKFEFTITKAPYSTWGLMTQKYTGQAAAVGGWGTHASDYPTKGSDLLRGRANEVVAKHNLP